MLDITMSHVAVINVLFLLQQMCHYELDLDSPCPVLMQQLTVYVDLYRINQLIILKRIVLSSIQSTVIRKDSGNEECIVGTNGDG